MKFVLTLLIIFPLNAFCCIEIVEYQRAKELRKKEKESLDLLIKSTLSVCKDNSNSETCSVFILNFQKIQKRMLDNFQSTYPSSSVCEPRHKQSSNCKAYLKNFKNLEKEFLKDLGCDYGTKQKKCKKQFDLFLSKVKASEKDYPKECYTRETK